MSGIPPDQFIHPEWKAIVPPASSITHPTLYPPPGSIAWTALSTSDSSDTGRRSPVGSDTSALHLNEFPPLPSEPRKSPNGISHEALNNNDSRALDRFAPIFVPRWLQHLPPPRQTYFLPPPSPFPPPTYSTRVFPPGAPLPIPTVCPSILSSPPVTTPPAVFDPTTIAQPGYYASHFSSLLSLNLAAEAAQLEKGVIHCIPVVLRPEASKGVGGNKGLPNKTVTSLPAGAMFAVTIPGIREDAPKLQLGDRLLFRGLDTDHQLASLEAVEAEVVGLVKMRGVVYVRSAHLMELDRVLPKYRIAANENSDKIQGRKEEETWASKYQIRFYASAAPVCAMQDAVRTMGLSLKIRFDAARRWLCPEKGDVSSRPPGDQVSKWIDQTLNQEQQSAVSAIVTMDHRVPYLIDGPPGTGKTKTLVEAILQVLVDDPDASILVCAPSNPASDTLARRLARALPPSSLLRLNAPNRTFAEVPDNLLLHCHIAGDAFGIPPYEELMMKKVVVVSCLDAEILQSARMANMVTMQAEFDLIKALHPSEEVASVMPHWTHLVIDEAAQASEPEVMVPISVVMPYPLPPGCATKDPAIILCGDIHQLGPIIASRPARDGGLDISLLERLFERDVYMTYTQTSSGTDSAQYYTSPPCTHLIRNYRSIAPILMVPAALFYEDALLASAKDVKLMKWSGLPNPRIPVLFQGCNTKEDTIDEGTSWFNMGEIKLVLGIVKSILGEVAGLQQKEIAVITPWREQVWKLRKGLRAAGFSGVDVGNVETYQGGEFRVTILSCVRSSERFLSADREANMGLFDEAKRFNVAITRAKELLVVVGNADLLKADRHWNGFLQIAKRNNLYRGPDFQLSQTNVYQSKIEASLRLNRRD